MHDSDWPTVDNEIRLDRLLLTQSAVPLTSCQSWDGRWWEHLEKEEMQCHSQPIVMGWEMNRVSPGKRRNAVSLTGCWSWDERWWDYLAKEEMQCHSHPVGHGVRYDKTAGQKTCSATYQLLAMGGDMMTPGQRKCSVTCLLLVIG